MPIYVPRTKIETKCKKCGKVYSYYVGGFGDNLNPWDMKVIMENLQSHKCPKCGYKNTNTEEDK